MPATPLLTAPNIIDDGEPRLKRVVSVSLGASTGDFKRELKLNGIDFTLSRVGCNADMELAASTLEKLDGHVDAIGLGGIDVYLRVAGDQFVIGDGLRLAQHAKITPVVDGSGLKETLERTTVETLVNRGYIQRGTKVLMVSALDRFGMAEALVAAGCECKFGDLIFNMKIDYPLTTLEELKDLARKYRSRLLTVPFRMLYPTGAAQNERSADGKFAHYYCEADVIAGDRHLILKHMPQDLHGKIILTNTTRPDTVDELRKAGARILATTTPDMDGVSAGTNVMEAAVVALADKPLSAITRDDYVEWSQRLKWQGEIHVLN